MREDPVDILVKWSLFHTMYRVYLIYSAVVHQINTIDLMLSGNWYLMLKVMVDLSSGFPIFGVTLVVVAYF